MKFTDEYERREFFGREALKELQVKYPELFKFDLKLNLDKYGHYDAYYHIIDEQTHTIKKRVFIEIKIRDTEYPEYILETKKINSLLKIRKDLNLNENELTIIYINFTPTKTIIWNIDKVKDLPKSIIRANKATSTNRTDKIDKSVIMVGEQDGVVLDYILDYKVIESKFIIKEIVNKHTENIGNDLFRFFFSNTSKEQ